MIRGGVTGGVGVGHPKGSQTGKLLGIFEFSLGYLADKECQYMQQKLRTLQIET